MDYACPALRETRQQKIDENGDRFWVIALNGSASILQASVAAGFLRRTLAESEALPVVVDLTMVEDVDVAFLQLLVSTGKARPRGCEISLLEVTEDHSLSKAARVAGIAPQSDGTWFGLKYPSQRRARE
ncbi:MAG: STAS domain-containing protein [Candidatus Riflebacteria bacterium]|jgi:anti-anti-sigma regulatory factor|nr:STAS domain-containing protein [Candidatus Riflebacteria bacterium]